MWHKKKNPTLDTFTIAHHITAHHHSDVQSIQGIILLYLPSAATQGRLVIMFLHIERNQLKWFKHLLRMHLEHPWLCWCAENKPCGFLNAWWQTLMGWNQDTYGNIIRPLPQPLKMSQCYVRYFVFGYCSLSGKKRETTVPGRQGPSSVAEYMFMILIPFNKVLRCSTLTLKPHVVK